MAPDGLGLGENSGHPIPYLVARGYAVSVFAAHDAAKTLAPRLSAGTSLTTALVPVGYSEGGFAALALHNLAQSAALRGLAPWVPLSLPSGGPYDLLLQGQLSLAAGASYPVPAYIAYIATSFSTFFGVEAVAVGIEETVESFFDGSHGVGEINQLVAGIVGGTAGGILSANVEADVLAGNLTMPLVGALVANSFATGWAPQARSSVHLCHGDADDVVFSGSADAASSLPRSSYLALPESTCTTHASCAAFCMFDTLNQLASFESVPDNRGAPCSSDQCTVRRGRRPVTQ